VTLDQFLQYIFAGLSQGSIYALTAMSFTLVFNATRIINFSQGQMVMLGGMTLASLWKAGVPLWAAVLLAVLIVTGISIVFERVAIRPLLRAGVLAQIIATVGASFAFEAAAMLIWGRDAVLLPSFPGGTQPVGIAGASITWQEIGFVGLTLIIVVALQLFYRKSLFGTAVRACSVDPTAARMQGISYGAVVMFSFALAGAVSAAAGAAFTPIQLMSYRSGTLFGLKGFAAATLGGLGSPVGAVVGGYSLGIIEALGVGLVSADYKDAISFVILLLVLFVRPTGLFGQKGVTTE
jgi:branched-chain amino acid transport system permease protein